MLLHDCDVDVQRYAYGQNQILTGNYRPIVKIITNEKMSLYAVNVLSYSLHSVQCVFSIHQSFIRHQLEDNGGFSTAACHIKCKEFGPNFSKP